MTWSTVCLYGPRNHPVDSPSRCLTSPSDSSLNCSELLHPLPFTHLPTVLILAALPLCPLESCSFVNKLSYTLCFFREYSGYFFTFVKAWPSSRTPPVTLCRKVSHFLTPHTPQDQEVGLALPLPHLYKNSSSFGLQPYHLPPFLIKVMIDLQVLLCIEDFSPWLMVILISPVLPSSWCLR